MKSLKTISLISGLIGLTGALLTAPAMSAPGFESDGFYLGETPPIHTYSSSLGSAASQGYDAFRTGDGEPISDVAKGYMGTSLGGSTGQGWDVFNLGDGDKM